MAALDYSFIGQEETPEEPGGLDYSFIGSEEPQGGVPFSADPSQSQLVPPPENLSNLDRLGERLMNIQVPAWTGVGAMAAKQDPTMEQANKDLKAAGTPLEKRGVMAEYISSLAAKGLVDIADMFTEGDVREEMSEINNLISSEARATLGNPEMQYTGSGPEKFGMEVAEGAANMVPALVAGWGTKNPGVTLGVMGGQVAGNTYNNYMDKTGGDHTKSMLAAKFHTAAEIIPETLPVLAILRKAGGGQAITRMMEATIGEGAQEMLTSVLQQTYDNAELEGMSLKEAINGIDWSDVAHDGAIGFFVGGTLATPGTIADIAQDRRGKVDQAENPPELFTPTHTAGGGQPVQIVTKKGQVVPDTYMTESGEVIRDSNAIQNNPGVDPAEYDIAAVIERTKAEIGFDAGIVGSQMESVEMPTGIENINITEPIETAIQRAEETGDATSLQGRLAEVYKYRDQGNKPPPPPPPPPPGSAGIVAQQMELEPALVDAVSTAQIEPAPAPTATETEITETKPVEGSVVAQPIEAVEITEAASEAATSPENDLVEPTEGQKEAGNYKKGHTQVQGMDIAIENPAGSKRRPEWPTLKSHYGYIKRTEGNDGDQVDVFVKPDTDIQTDNPVFIIDQANEDGKGFDEHKVMIGYETEAEAREAYLANFTKGWKGLKSITPASPDEFKAWLKDGSQTEGYAQPAAKKLEPKAKKAETKAAVPPGPIGTPGKKAKINVISTGETLDGVMAVVDAGDLITSNDQSGNPNPAYPKEIQPRDRKKGSSLLQVQKMANDLKPELLEDNGQANGGAPIIGPDGVVESGNGRTLAIQRAYEQNKAEGYREHLIKNAASYGLTEADIKAMKSPVLVRTRQGDMSFNERAEFARQANQSGTAPMTPVENAQSDAERITDEEMQIYLPSDQGNILAASNQSFLEAFGKRLGDLAVGGLSTPDGRWTKQMADRVQAAVFYKAYGDEKLLSLVAEEADPDIKNILNALNKAAPAFARARAVHDDLGELDIISDIVGAIDLIRDAKSKGTSVKQIVDQAGLFGDVDPVIAAVASFIESTTRSAKKMGAGFTEMATFLEAEMKNLTQDSLFDMAPATKADIIDAANKRIKEEYGDEKGIQDLFAQSESEKADSFSPAEPSESGKQGAAETQAQGVNKVNVVQSGYEIPAANRKADLSVKEEEAVQWDLFAPSDVPAETAKQQAADSFFTRYEQVETGTFRTGVDTIEDPGQLAHLMASTRKHAQEVFSIVVTDKNNKVVNVIRHSKGTLDGASVYPGVVVGAIASTEGAANVWFSHNHPTGVSRPSDADFNITRVIEKMADGLDVNMKGHVVIGAGKYTHFTSSGTKVEANPQYIPPAIRDKTVPVTERMLRKRNRNAEDTLSGPGPVKAYLNTLFTDTGILLLNNRNAPTGVIAITKPEMKKLRDGHQVKRIMSAIDKTNSSAVIIFDKTSTHKPGDLHKEISNLSNFLARLDVRHLDTFIGGTSLAGRDEHSGSRDMPFFRRDDSTDPYQEMLGRDISYEVEVESTGKTYTVTVDAGATMIEMDNRIEALKELRNCI